MDFFSLSQGLGENREYLNADGKKPVEKIIRTQRTGKKVKEWVRSQKAGGVRIGF